MPGLLHERPALLRRLRTAEPWQAFLLKVEKFPIPREERPRLFEFLELFTSKICLANGLAEWFLIQFNQLHHEDGPKRLSENGPKWQPQLGLGVWPDREPPTLWTIDEFKNLAPGEMVRPLSHQLFRAGGGPEACRDARRTLFGIGAGLQMLTPRADAELLQRTTMVLKPRIQEPSFLAYEYYAPLLDRASLELAAGASGSVDVLDGWLCGARVYIRESVEDAGILLVSSVQLDETFRAMGVTQSQDQKDLIVPL